MQKLRKLLAVMLVLVLLVQAAPIIMAEEATGQTRSNAKVLYVFDLESFIDTLPTSKVRYDYVKLATALQGLANREQPQLYFYFLDGDEAKQVGWDMDEYWLSKLREEGAYLSDYTVETVSDYWELLTLFKDYYNGIVLWDEEVPATSNVASTIAGVENLLPVRYATGESDLYTAMLSNGFTASDIKKNLVGMFTGTGTIPGSSTLSTGSAKDDAYIWAKENYLDQGLTNPLLMTYSIDGGSWVFEDDGTAVRNARFVSAALPATMTPGEIVRVKITVKNTGTETWKNGSYYRLGLTKIGEFGFYTDAEGTTGVTSNRDRLSLTRDVAPGDQYTFEGYLKAPAAEGAYELGMGMILDGVEWFGKKYFHGITVAECADTNTGNDADIMMVGKCENGSMTVRVKNTGTTAWALPDDSGIGYYLKYSYHDVVAYAAPQSETAVGSNSAFVLNISSEENSVAVTMQMVYRFQGGEVAFGDAYTAQTNVSEATATTMWDMDFLSLEIPEYVTEGATAEAIVIVKNTGTETWAESLNGVRLTLDKRVSSYVGAADDEGKLGNRVRLENGITVEPGAVYLFHFDLHSRQSAEDSTSTDLSGQVSVKLQMLKERSTEDSAYMWFADTENVSYVVQPACREFTEESPVTCGVVDSKSGYNAIITSVALPDEMTVGEIVKVRFTVRNTGSNTIYCSDQTSQGQKIGVTGFKIYTSANKTSTDSGSFNRLKVKTSTAAGATYTFEGYIEAPTTAGTHTLKLQMVDETSGGVGWFGSTYEKTIEVKGSIDDGLVETPIGDSGIIYDNLFNTALANADYYISNKAFFWDLSPDASIAPIDDRTQPIGSDVATLKAILLSQAQQADAAAENGNGTGIYTVGGFVPWFLKYTSYADPNSSMEAVTAEWTMVEIISTYHGQTDADAYGTVGLSNASVFSKVPLSDNLSQNNDKGENSQIVYDPDTAYIMFYMGDWDGAAWVNGILPFIWEESQKDAAAHLDDPLPLAWPINSCLADRIPQVYNMLYFTAGATDYFVTGDNGTGYLNPMFLEGEYVPTGLEDYLEEWAAHNIAANEKFDLDITGFLIEGTLSNGSGSTATVRQAYSQMTPYGVVSSNEYDNIVHDGVTTPFPKMYSLSNMRTEEQRQAAAKTIAGNIKFDGQFFVYRSVKASRGNVRATLELLEEQNPGIKYEVVDPYTFMKLYAQYAESAAANTGAVYEAVQSDSAITIDGEIGTNEWIDANSMVVSKTSQEVTDHGQIWGSFAETGDLDVTYRIKWDSSNLYLLEERTDDYVKACYATGKTPLYDIDATMLFLDLDGVRDGAKFFTGDFAVHYSFDKDNQAVVYLRTGTDSGDKNHTLLTDDDVRAVRKVTETGYVVEIAIPWSLLANDSFSYMPAPGNTVGMSVLAIDHDESTTGARQIMWHGNGDTQDNWGVLKFVSKAKVSFVDGSTVLKTVDVWVGDTVESFTPTKSGYTFKGWYTSSDATVPYPELFTDIR